MLPSTYLTALLALTTTTSAASIGPRFKLQFRRYPDSTCSDNSDNKHHVHHGDGVEVKEAKCRSWDNDEGFSSYDFKWRHHKGEGRPTHQSCTLWIYPERGCKGKIVDHVDLVDEGKEDDKCRSDMTGEGRSAKISCEPHI